MDYDIMEVITQITKDKSLDLDYVLDTVKEGLLSAAKKKWGHTDNIRVEIDRKENDLYMIATKVVVDEVKDYTTEILLEDAREIDSEAEIGDEMEIEIPFDEFGRGAIAAAKLILVQRIREKEREQVYNEYSGRIGELVTGNVQQVDKGAILINLGRAEAVVTQKEQIPRERYRQGDRIRCVILDVQRVLKGPQVILSRADDSVLRRLYELEVPEIFEKIIEIKRMAREPGERAKIAVISHDARVDPVGACVGVKGVRVQAIVRELGNERIDIVHWDADPEIFVTRALAPATVVQIITDVENKAMEVVVDDEKLSLAIGRNGQNARLAARLTGWKITIVSENEFLERKTEHLWPGEEISGIPLSECDEISSGLAKKLFSAAIETVEMLAEKTVEELQEIEGIGPKTAEKLLNIALTVLARRKAEILAAGESENETEQEEPEEPSQD
jgi:N utilization substance protein A